MRLQRHYFALATLAFGEVMRVLANSWASLTGGPGGISVPFGEDSWWMLNFKSTRPHYYLTLAALTAVTGLFVAIQRSALGYRLRAVREDIHAAEVVGVDSARTKIFAATISGALIAALGTLYAQFTFFFDPDTVFGIASVSICVALIAILGGAGLAIGPIVGAFVIIPLEEAANFAFSSQAAGLSALVYGLLLVAIILIEPRGLVALLGLRQRWNR